MDVASILIDGKWRAARRRETFHAENPPGEPLPLTFPIQLLVERRRLTAATKARGTPHDRTTKIATFLEPTRRTSKPQPTSHRRCRGRRRLALLSPHPQRDVELPRTTNQLRQAAAAVREESWRHVTLDLEKNIRSCFAPIGPVVVFGPNNFPFAFNGVSGGDFAAAIAAGNPVIAKAHPLHPNTTRLLAEQALKAVESSGLPPATVQLIYNVSNENGLKLVSDPRVGAVGFTGSRNAGLHLKRAAEDAGKPIYLEMSRHQPGHLHARRNC
jgi:NADP-dependent aldehyde dehydrogenase